MKVRSIGAILIASTLATSCDEVEKALVDHGCGDPQTLGLLGSMLWQEAIPSRDPPSQEELQRIFRFDTPRATSHQPTISKYECTTNLVVRWGRHAQSQTELPYWTQVLEDGQLMVGTYEISMMEWLPLQSAIVGADAELSSERNRTTGVSEALAAVTAEEQSEPTESTNNEPHIANGPDAGTKPAKPAVSAAQPTVGSEVDGGMFLYRETVEIYWNDWRAYPLMAARPTSGMARATIIGEGKTAEFNGNLSINCENGTHFWESAGNNGDVLQKEEDVANVVPAEAIKNAVKLLCKSA